MNRLDALAREIRQLRSALPEVERDAYGIADINAIERAAVTRARLDAALALYFNEAEAARKSYRIVANRDSGRFQ
jgi:hypothetical protein